MEELGVLYPEESRSKVSVANMSPAPHPQCVRASAVPKCSVAWALPWWRCGARTAAAPTNPVVSSRSGAPPQVGHPGSLLRSR
jgi:hypothetical protein